MTDKPKPIIPGVEWEWEVDGHELRCVVAGFQLDIWKSVDCEICCSVFYGCERCVFADNGSPTFDAARDVLAAWHGQYVEQLTGGELGRLRARVAELKADWQPIEKAPREGVFLVYLEEELLGSRVHTMRRQATQGSKRGYLATVATMFDFDAPRATHWCPLPAPPKEES